jgi:hypothetical protein
MKIQIMGGKITENLGFNLAVSQSNQSKEVDDIIIGAGCADSFCASQNTVPSDILAAPEKILKSDAP